jgi:hypothetical protein
MFKKIGLLAEELATTVGMSRRGFLGGIGKSALGVAGALGAWAATTSAQSGVAVCCKYQCPTFGYGKKGFTWVAVCQPDGSTCASGTAGCTLKNSSPTSDCSKCTG